jgi:hypothetical protein
VWADMNHGPFGPKKDGTAYGAIAGLVLRFPAS